MGVKAAVMEPATVKPSRQLVTRVRSLYLGESSAPQAL